MMVFAALLESRGQDRTRLVIAVTGESPDSARTSLDDALEELRGEFSAGLEVLNPLAPLVGDVESASLPAPMGEDHRAALRRGFVAVASIRPPSGVSWANAAELVSAGHAEIFETMASGKGRPH